MNVTTKQGKTGTIVIDSKKQTATLVVDGISYLIAFMRDNKIRIKSDLYLNDGDFTAVRTNMKQFIKKVEDSKKKRK